MVLPVHQELGAWMDYKANRARQELQADPDRLDFLGLRAQRVIWELLDPRETLDHKAREENLVNLEYLENRGLQDYREKMEPLDKKEFKEILERSVRQDFQDLVVHRV